VSRARGGPCGEHPLLPRQALTLLLLALLAVTLCAPARAQRAKGRRVAGRVVRAEDSSAVAGAFVEIVGTTLRATTGGDGSFTFAYAPPEALTVRVASVGFEPGRAVVPADTAAGPPLTIALVASPVVVAPLVVTASRETDLAGDAPISVSVATEDDIARRATIGLDDAIARLPGVQILDGQINIRGSSGYTKGLGSRVLLLVDGVPANEGDRGGIDWDLLPAMEVERVEVLKGTGSALYGSAALGGVVNVITRSIPDQPQFRARLLAGGYADPARTVWRWRSSRALFGGMDLSLSRPVGAFKLLVSGGMLGNQGYRENNDDRRTHALAKLVFADGPGVQAELLTAAAHEDHGNVVFWCVQGQCADSGLAAQPFRVDSTTLGDRVRSDKLLMQATARRIVGTDLALHGRLSWYRTHFQDAFRTDSEAATADRFGTELGMEWHPRADRVVNAAMEAAYSDVTSDLFGNHSQTEVAWDAENETALGGAGHATLGARIDAIAVDGVGWTAVASPRIAVTWRLPFALLRASLGRGFRAPSLAERFTSTSTQGIRVVPNPNLANETSWSGELGAATRASQHLALDAALFWNRYQNLIEPTLVTGGTEIQFANVTRARVRGLDLTARAAGLAGGHLSATLGYTLLDARDLTLDLPLAFRPRHQAMLSVDWLMDLGGAGDLAAGFDARVSSSPERVEIFESDPRVAARTLDVRATWRRRGVALVAKVENLFNYTYTLVPRTLEPPRTYSTTLTVTW
jgi:outer membrane receptor for ferrienterochelin and colicins